MSDNAKKVYTAVLLTLCPEQASFYLCFCILKASSCCLLNRKYQTMPDNAKKVYTAVLLTLRPEQASLYLWFCI